MSDWIVHKKRPKDYAGVLLLLCLVVLLLTSRNAYAITGNVQCTGGGAPGQINLGTLTPSQRFEFKITGTCKVLNTTFASPLILSQEQRDVQGKNPKYQVTLASNGLVVPELPLGSLGGVCLNNCLPVGSVGQTFPIDVVVAGNAPAAAGYYQGMILISATSSTVANREDYVAINIVTYTVAEAPCSIDTGKTLSVPFGDISSNDLAAATQPANIRMTCIGKGALVQVQLAPTQAAVSGSTGVSVTSLDGLAMAVTWADNNNPVAFNSPRMMLLPIGTKTIGFKFRPQLMGTTFPTGQFYSQYTFNITYY